MVAGAGDVMVAGGGGSRGRGVRGQRGQVGSGGAVGGALRGGREEMVRLGVEVVGGVGVVGGAAEGGGHAHRGVGKCRHRKSRPRGCQSSKQKVQNPRVSIIWETGSPAPKVSI